MKRIPWRAASVTEATDEKPKRTRRKAPYIALELDAFEDAEKAARKAGVHADVVMAGLPRLWVHCWRRKTDRVRPEDLDQFFTGADERLRRALAAVGFTEIDGDPAGDRVKGAARLLRISASKSRGGHAAKGNLLRGSARPDATPAYAGDGPGIGPAEARLLQPAANSQQPTGLPPTPLAGEGGGSETRSRRRPRDREPPAPDPAPRALGWTLATPQGRAWRERLDQLRAEGADYAVSVLERLRPVELAEAGALVVTADDGCFTTWCREHYGGLLQGHQVLIVQPAGAGPPQLRVLEGGGAA